MRPNFQNVATLDFGLEPHRQAFEAALQQVKATLGSSYPCLIDGKEESCEDKFDSISPADPSVVIGRLPKMKSTDAIRALESADRAFPSWSQTSAKVRAGFLFSAAAKVRKRRHFLSALMVYEVGKSWDEADGEVAECADLMEYYALQMLQLDGTHTEHLAKMEDEATDFFYIPLGAGAIISPWNFPMALTFGMASAAMVAGNTVVIKPASTSAVSVYHFARIFWDMGLPAGVMNLVTGPGGELGDALVDHPRTRFIAFTGSMEVGTRIFERASKVQPGQLWLKRTVLEMGGKNAIIVDREADLETAADAVVAAAFGFQGQKCSAGSRAIIDTEVYDRFVPMVVERATKLRTGDTLHYENTVGPVIDKNAFAGIKAFIEKGKGESKLLLGGGDTSLPGYFVSPTIFGDVSPNATIAQEEIFGPVLACLRAADFDDALRIANGTRFGLTGAVFSRNRMKLERARHEFHVGNLYFNRKSTGALMGVHPFGGFNMSGTDSKAGGPDYLLHFLQGKAVGDRLA